MIGGYALKKAMKRREDLNLLIKMQGLKLFGGEKCFPCIQNELDRIAEAMRLFECYASKWIFGAHRYRFGYLKDGR